MDCWDHVNYSLQVPGAGFLFDIGKTTNDVYFALIENQRDSQDPDYHVAVGKVTEAGMANVREEITVFPGPIYFEVPVEVISNRALTAFAVDDSGESPIFYLGHGAGEEFTFSLAAVSIFSSDGALLQQEVFGPMWGSDSLTVADLQINRPRRLWHDEYDPWPMIDMIFKENHHDGTSWRYYTSKGSSYLYQDGFGIYYPWQPWEGTSFEDQGYVGRVITKDGWMWELARDRQLLPDESGTYSIYLYDSEHMTKGYNFLSPSPTEGVPSGDMRIGIGCNGKDLLIGMMTGENEWDKKLTHVWKYSFDQVYEHTMNPENGTVDFSDVPPQFTPDGCAINGRISHDGRSLLTQETYVGDGAYAYFSVSACTPSEEIKYLRQRQRNDRRNAPRVGRANNQPTSLQHSLRSSRSGNFYMRERVPCGC